MKIAKILPCLVAVMTALTFAMREEVPPRPTLLSFRVGQSFEEVVKASSYKVIERSNVPKDSESLSGNTFVTEPAVILCFNDPQHGFILPPTNFALVGYARNAVATASTSPMLAKVSFDEAVAILENLQNQFRAGGWEPWVDDGSQWFDLTQEGKKRLYQRMFEPGYSVSVELRVPKKYGMTFRIKCTDGCWPGEKPPYLFLVDVGVGRDNVDRTRDDPQVWEKTFPGSIPSAAPPRFTCPSPRVSKQPPTFRLETIATGGGII